MTQCNERLSSVDQLRQFVLQTLCRQNDLEMGVFPASERMLVKRGRPVGIQFCLHGPRNVRFMAIWETEKQTILFYGSSGQRTGRVQLSQSPQLRPEPKAAALSG